MVVALFFILWDVAFTKMGIWGFNPEYLIGIFIFNLPIEEILFFICIPYACVFTYFALKELVVVKLKQSIQKKINSVLIILFVFFSIYFNDKLYTLFSFTLAYILLIYAYFSNRDFSYIYLTYLFTIPFFLLSNGALTLSLIHI